MAINALFCTDNSEQSVDFSGLSISVGNYITVSDFTGGSPELDIFLCAQITDGNQPGSSFSATSNVYSSCYDCLVNNFTVVSLVACDDETITPVFPISAFGYIPIVAQVIYAEIEFNDRGNFTTYTKCFKVNETATQVSENSYNNDYDFSNLNQKHENIRQFT